MSLDLVRKLVQENDLHACQPRAYKVTTISGATPTPAIADHVKRDFTAAAPGPSSSETLRTSAAGLGGSTWPR